MKIENVGREGNFQELLLSLDSRTAQRAFHYECSESTFDSGTNASSVSEASH